MQVYKQSDNKKERKAIEIFLKCTFVRIIEFNIDAIVNDEYKDITESTSTFDFIEMLSKSDNRYNKELWKKRTKQEQFTYNLIYNCIEFMNSYEQLQTSIDLLEHLEKEVNKYDLLKFYFETFISELYIFRKRIENIFNLMYKNAKALDLKNDVDIINENKMGFLESFEPLNKFRTSHVHYDRYSDEFFSKVKTFKYFMKEFPIIDKSILENDLIENYAIHKENLLGLMKAKLVAVEHITIRHLDELENLFVRIFNGL